MEHGEGEDWSSKQEGYSPHQKKEEGKRWEEEWELVLKSKELKRSNLYTWGMELRGILRGGGNSRKSRRTDCGDRGVATISTMAQSILHVAETNSQRGGLSLQLLIIFLERVVILSQLIDVEPMAIQTAV